jgi:hypothetical protein
MKEKKQRKTELLECGLLERCNHSMLANCYGVENCLRAGKLCTEWSVL